MSLSSCAKLEEYGTTIEEPIIEKEFYETVKMEPKAVVPEYPFANLDSSNVPEDREDLGDVHEESTKVSGILLPLDAESDVLGTFIVDTPGTSSRPVDPVTNGDVQTTEEMNYNDQFARTATNLNLQNIYEGARVKEKHKQQQQNFPPTFCSGAFVKNRNKIGHEKMHTRTLDLSCSVCGKVLSCISSKVRHEKTHLKERPYRCIYCGKGFVENCTKITHERIHTGERPFSCRYCGKSFTQQGQRKIHERIHTEERPFCCHFCSKTFTRQTERLMHERLHIR